MADIEIFDNFKGLTKNKKVLLFAGLGLGAGVLVLAFRGASGGSGEDAMVVEDAEKDQSISVLGSQMAAFEQAVKQNQDSIVAQLEQTTEAYESLTEDFSDYQKSSEDKLLALQTAAQASQDSLVAQLIKLQNKQSDLEDDIKSSSKKSSSPKSSKVPASSTSTKPETKPPANDNFRDNGNGTFKGYDGKTYSF